MSFNYNPLRDEVGFENYMALYLSIKGYIPKGKTTRVFPSAKDALKMLDIPTNDDKKIEGE